MRFVRDNSLSIVFGVLFLAALTGQAIAGQHDYNENQVAHDADPVSFWPYVASSRFGVEMLENWQSEYLQFSLFILATIWLYQRGSNESKRRKDLGLESDEQQQVGPHAKTSSPRWARTKDWRHHLYANSLLLDNDNQTEHGQQEISWSSYLGRGDFWERTLSNWQSEFLAVGSMAVFTVYLRQRGSPESKLVGAPHDETATSG